MSKKKSEYERVKAVWYKKLKDSGFEDIEHEDGSINSAVPRLLRKNDELSRLRVETIQDYYCMAQHFLNDYQFDTERDKIIWEYYTHGFTLDETTRLLKQAGLVKVSRDIVWHTIQRLEPIMKGLYLSV